MTPKSKARLLLLATALLWGATFTLVKSALAHITPLLFNLLRFAFATVALAVLNRKALRAVTPSQLRSGALVGLLLAAGYQFQTFGLARTSAAHSAFVTGMVVVFVPLLAFVPAVRPRGTAAPRLVLLLFSAVAFAGLVLLTVPAQSSVRQINLGDLLTLVCAVAFAAHMLALARAAHGIPAGLLATLQIAFCTLAMLLSLPLEPHPHVDWTPALLLTLVVCALFATAAAFTIQSYAQQHLPPTQTVLILVLEPVFGALTAILVLGETLTARALLGAALMLTAILATELLPQLHSSEIPA